MAKTPETGADNKAGHPGRKRFLAKLQLKQAQARALKLKHAPSKSIRSKLNAKPPSSPKCGFASPLKPPTRKQTFRSFSTGEYVQPREIGIPDMIANALGKKSTQWR